MNGITTVVKELVFYSKSNSTKYDLRTVAGRYFRNLLDQLVSSNLAFWAIQQRQVETMEVATNQY